MSYVVEAAGRFYDEAGFNKVEDFAGFIEDILADPTVFIIVNEGKGFIIGRFSTFFLEPTKTLCSELAWFVEPEYRGTTVAIRLLKEYEQYAKDNECDLVSMVALEEIEPVKTGKIYTRMGYTPLEHQYIKEI